MIDRFDICKITDENKESIFIANWAWNSHWWVETSPGYCECKWCGKKHTSVMGVNSTFPLCIKNPAIQNFITTQSNLSAIAKSVLFN